MNRLGKSHLLMLLIGLVIGAVALGAIQAAMHSTTDVRVGVKRLADGRVEVKVQQLDDEQAWQDLELPPARFLELNVPVDAWRYTNPIPVSVAEEEAEVIILREPPLMCVLGHAYPEDDRFWRWTLAGAGVAAYQYGVQIVRYGAIDSEEHAADLRDCISRGPITIATSLPYADDLREPLAEAQAAGIQVVTFNSGAEDADSVGSLMHIGLDDFAGGVKAGEQFVAAEVTGTMLCVIHETDNVGLEDRCNGLESSYGAGHVERIWVDLTRVSPDDEAYGGHRTPEHVQDLLTERIAAGGVGGILTLNHDTGIAAIGAVQESGADIALGSFGFSDELADAVRDGEMLFLVWDHPVAQGYLAVSAMALAFTLELSDLNAEVFLNGAEILIEPTLADQERAENLKSMFAGPPPTPQTEDDE
ncbi:MAG: substrate-binding domain-containing protein [Chloroflexota bacterium]|nr:substrate-binding domain-containing protein [Chloroflexota bacterium]MDE2894070.1 substrate-binding domain-containing protein [Chloroflexota bacterium]